MRTHEDRSSVGIGIGIAFLAAAALAAGACGSSGAKPQDGSAGDTTGGGADLAVSGCSTSTDPIDPTAILDDMEDRNFTIRSGSGSWWAGGNPNPTPGAAITPDGDAAPAQIPGGRCGSNYAEHVTGHGYDQWAVLTMSFGWSVATAMILPFDAHIRQGVTFWARIGDTSSDQVRLGVSDKNSRPEGGLCVEGGAMDVACFDTFGVQLTGLDTAWKQYRIPFGGLTQRNFGLHADAVDTSALYTIEFSFTPGSTFDFWVDDISFY